MARNDISMEVPNFIRTPAESTTRFLTYADRLRKNKGITFGCVMDNHVVPLAPGDVVSVVSRPGHGKTAFMSHLSRRAARMILDEGKYNLNQDIPGEVVLYVSWEQIIEQIEANMQAGDDYTVSDIAWGRADMDIVRQKALTRPRTPIWLVGQSVEDSNKRMPPMTFDIIYENIRNLKENFNVVPKLICMDYLQIIPVQGFKNRNEAVSEAIYKTKELAIGVGCPIVIGVQAREATEDRNEKIPGLSDAYYTSAVGHVADKNFGLLKPIKLYPEGKQITMNGTPYNVDKNLFLVRMTKQRMEDGAKQWAMNFDMSAMKLWDFSRDWGGA